MAGSTKTEANAPEFSMSAEELMDSAKEQQEQLVEVQQIENTPFQRLKHKGKLYLALGKYRLTEELETEEELTREVMDESWFRIMQVADIMAREAIKEIEEKIKKMEEKLNGN